MGGIAGIRFDPVPVPGHQLFDIHHVVGFIVGLPCRGAHGDKRAQRSGHDEDSKKGEPGDRGHPTKSSSDRHGRARYRRDQPGLRRR